GDEDAARGLDGLADERAGVPARERGARRGGVAERHEAHRPEHRPEVLPVLLLAGDRYGGDGAAVERPLGGDDGDALGTARHHLLVAAGELERGLVRLPAGVAEEGAVGEAAARERVGEADLLLDEVEVRRVDEPTRLHGDGGGELGVGVAEAAHGDPRRHVEVALAADVPQLHALAARQHDRLLLVVLDEVMRGDVEEVFVCRHDVSSVPTPRSVKISSRSACSMRPSMMWILRTPAASAARADSTFGIIPPVMVPSAISSRPRAAVRLGNRDPSLPFTPGTSVRRTSFS